jgi:hypothetical protein
MFQFSADGCIALSRRSFIEVQQPARPRTASHPRPAVDHRRGRDQPIVEPLMIPLSVKGLEATQRTSLGEAFVEALWAAPGGQEHYTRRRDLFEIERTEDGFVNETPRAP